jgi:hypothetical protein
MIWLQCFSFSILSKLTLVTNHSHICNLKPLFSCICDFKLLLHGAIEDSHINNHKNGWFGHKLQTKGLV